VLSKPLDRTGARIPSFQGRLEYNGGGNTKGWHEAQTEFARKVDKLLADPGPGAAGDKIVQTIGIGNRTSHNSNTPLVVGAFSLNPNDYSLTNATVQFWFSIVAANGTTPLTTHAVLYNLTDGEVVTSSQINIVDSTNPQRHSVLLDVGAGAGKIKNNGDKVYECRIYLDAPPNNENETIELYKADLQIVFTVTMP